MANTSMRFLRYRAVTLAGLSAAALAQQDRPPCHWETDFAAARQIARRDGKDLLVYFTSPDDCAWCRVLDRTVLSAPEFSRACSDFVLIRLDFSADESRTDAAAKTRRESLMNLWGVTGFPTIVLADAEARPFVLMAGHQPDGPKAVLDRLTAARATHDRAAALFKQAGQADPGERTALLDEALSALPLPTEQLIRIYRPEIEAILAGPADDDLRRRYRQMLDDEADRAFQEEVRRKVREAAGTLSGSRAVIAVFDEAIAAPNLTRSRREWLLVRKANHLYTEGALPAAEAALSAALEGRGPLDDPNSEIFRAQMLFESGRTDEGVRRLERLADLYAALPEYHWGALDRKAQVLGHANRMAEALSAADLALQAAATPRHRYATQAKRAVLLLDAGRPADSVAACRDALAALREMGIADLAAAHCLVDLAAALRATGDDMGARVAAETARQVLRESDPAALAAEPIASKLARSAPLIPREAPRPY
jgi:thioredoxin-related protein